MAMNNLVHPRRAEGETAGELRENQREHPLSGRLRGIKAANMVIWDPGRLFNALLVTVQCTRDIRFFCFVVVVILHGIFRIYFLHINSIVLRVE